MKPKPKKKYQPAPISLAPTDWDKGAMGKANRLRLVEEPATDFDPATGRVTPNPNGVKRVRRQSWAEIYHRQGHLTDAQACAAANLYAAWAGNPTRDPLAAIQTRAEGGTFDPQAALVDRRAMFRTMWDLVPFASLPVVSRVVLNELPIWHGNPDQRARHMDRLRAGLDAICLGNQLNHPRQSGNPSKILADTERQNIVLEDIDE